MRRAAPLLGALLLAGCVASGLGDDRGEEGADAAAADVRPLAPAPQLVVLLVVDQLQATYFDRFASNLHGGLGRIRSEAVFFPNGQQAHALTETAPGHASLASGRYPAHTHIVSNDLGVVDPDWPLIGSDGEGASPARFVGTTLYDWMRAADPESLALSVSRKNRGAILPVGRAAADVVWYGGAGGFTWSRWYGDVLPDWLLAWNRGFDLRRFAGRAWSPVLPEGSYPESDAQPWENGGVENTFPHRLPSAPDLLADALEDVPWMDSLTLDVALTGARARRLGQRGHTDYLAVSLSSTDAVGHTYGPDSREIHDQVVRLDGWLGVFLDSLAALVPTERTLLVLSADHGVTPYAEAIRARGGGAGNVDLSPLVDSLAGSWRARWGTDFGVAFDNGLLYANAPALAARGVRVDSLAEALAERVLRPGVARALTERGLSEAPPSDRDAELWKRSLPADGRWLLALVAEPEWVFSDEPARAQHGTLSPVNSRIPIAFVVPGVAPRSVERTIESVDVAPTLAALLGIRPTEPIDGKIVGEATRPVVAANAVVAARRGIEPAGR